MQADFPQSWDKFHWEISTKLKSILTKKGPLGSILNVRQPRGPNEAESIIGTGSVGEINSPEYCFTAKVKPVTKWKEQQSAYSIHYLLTSFFEDRSSKAPSLNKSKLLRRYLLLLILFK